MSPSYNHEVVSAGKPNLGSILIVDDNQNIIHLIRSALQGQPAVLLSATTGQEALRRLHEQKIDLLLLDARLPDMTGFEICRIIKGDERLHHVKIMVVNSSSATDDKIRAFEAGADDYITKPFKTKEFQARVRVMLNLGKAERQLTDRNEQLLELIRVSQMLNLRLDLKTTGDEIVKSAQTLSKADRVYLFLWDEETQEHRQVSALNPVHPQIPRLIKGGRGLIGEVLQEGKIVLVQDYDRYKSRLDMPPGSMFETAGIPLRIGNRHLGVVVLSMARQEKHFNPDDLDILTNLANQAAVAIDNARLYADLRQKEETYRLIAEKASDLIISIDRRGIITFVNERVRSLLSFEPDELTGQNISRYFTPEAGKRIQALFENAENSNWSEQAALFTVEPLELRMLNKGGTPLNLEFNFGLVFQDEEAIGLQGIGRDVSARKRSEENERMRVLGQMASGVAHDFNNVLANVLGHAQLLETQVANEEWRSILQIIAQSALDGAETVRRIQEFTTQHSPQNFDLVDMNQIVQSTIDLSRPRWRDDAQLKGMQIEVERDFEAVPPVRGKAAELREVIINIINNAVDAMSPPGAKILFRTTRQDRWVQLEITDTGKGMPPEIRRHIFEPFFTTKGTRGTGLGLSVAFGIVNRYGGEITCDSLLGAGTTFTIRFPAAEPDAEPKVLKRTGITGQLGMPRYQGRILAIDDEPGIRSVLRRTLQSGGFEVDVAGSGMEALAMLEKASLEKPDSPYDLILSDLGMPEMGGWEVAQAVSQRWENLPVVLVTGWGEQVDPDKMAEYNIRAIISKPFNIQDLLKIIAAQIPPSLS